MAELKTCPFCGGEAEMYTGRRYPSVGKGLCESVEVAKELLEEYRKHGTVVDFEIRKRSRYVYGMKRPKEKWSLLVVYQAFIPRCTDSKCIGRSQMMFKTEEEAIEAWNWRADDGKAD